MDAATQINALETQASHLPKMETSAQYFALVRRSLPLMLKCLATHGTPQVAKDIYEGQVVSDMVQRLLNSCSALETKHAFDDEAAAQVRVALEESGFPSYVHIDGLAVDLLHKDATLGEMRSDQNHLKKLIVDFMFEEKREPRVMLAELAKRTYLERLDRKDLFLPYTEGKLIPWKVSEAGVRGYLYSWGTYGVSLDCAYVHLMFMTQDLSEVPFEEKGDNLTEFLDIMSQEGSHVPDQLHILAKSIDDKLDAIHPKVIKRVRIGPLRTKAMIEVSQQEKLSEGDEALLSLFSRASRPGEIDFALMFSEEMTFSKEQVMTTKHFFKKVVQEVFFIPQLDDGEALIRYILMPHHFFQEILPEEAQHIPHYYPHRVRFGYDHKENVHEIR